MTTILETQPSATTTTTPRKTNWPQWLWICGFHVGALLALVPAFFTWKALLVCAVLHWLTTSIGISMTYHRLLTHRSFAVRPRFLEYVLTAIGSCGAQGGAISMASDHRRHHAFTEQEDDTHSPVKGLYWAHWKWWIYENPRWMHTNEYYQRWAPDLLKDPVHRVMQQIHWVFPISLLFALFAIGGMPWLVWGGFVRHVLCIHSSWSVNSIGHSYGYRNFATRDVSKNNWFIALITYGEGWHNNHHAAPTSANIGMRWYEIDMTYEFVRLLKLVGLARDVKTMKVTHVEPA